MAHRLWVLPAYDLTCALTLVHGLPKARGRELIEGMVALQWDILQANGAEWIYGIGRRYLTLTDLLDEYVYVEDLTAREREAMSFIQRSLPEAQDYFDQWFASRDQGYRLRWYQGDLVLEFH